MRLALIPLLLFFACDDQRLAEVREDPFDASVDATIVCTSPDMDPPTWSYLYATYFGPSTPGHCGNSGCHDTPPAHGNWVCGATPGSCYQGMLARVVNGRAAPLLNLVDPPKSLLINPAKSPLVWFNSLGNMPFDEPVENPCAKRDVPLWLHADGGGSEN